MPHSFEQWIFVLHINGHPDCEDALWPYWGASWPDRNDAVKAAKELNEEREGEPHKVFVRAIAVKSEVVE